LAVIFAGCGSSPAVSGLLGLDDALDGAASAIETQLAAGTEIVLAECEASPVKLAQYLDSRLSDKLVTGGLTVLARGKSLNICSA